VPGADSAVSRYDRLRIFYSNNNDTNFVGVASGNRKIAFSLLNQGSGPMEYSVALPSVSDVTVEFIGRVSPDIYAFSLESDTGVIVDNIPVRGSAGLEFVMTDSHDFQKCLEMLDPDLIILQYGLNVVKNVRSEYHYYEEGLLKQVEFLRKVSGGVPVMLVSLTDMAQKAGDSVRSYTNIPAIRDAQKNAAMRSGAIFWDAWESMGGEGSIVEWFNHNPSLASKDLTHLSNAGADTIASRLYNSFFIAETSAVNLIDTIKYETDSITTDTITLAGASPVLPQPEEEVIESRRSLFSLIRYHPEQTFIFTTPAFWIFFTVVMAGFALLRKRRAMCHTWLLFVSLYFYYRAGGLFIILLVLTALLTHFTALMTGRSAGRGWKRFWLISNILILVGFLSYFKYAGFITETVNAIFNTSFAAYDIFSAWSNNLFGTAFDVTSIVLPVGISFFTFQALSYSIDIYRGRMEPVKNVIDFSFYLTFFPQLVAGPIVRASEFIPQMKGDYTITRNEFGHGLFLIIQGLIKKMLISDFISAGFIDRVFDTPALYSGFENLMAVYGYGLQIYCDFSGYTDIAIGVAILMGFRLPLNFNSPYKATNITDFWRRWHITLSRWLKDYLYIPLGGSRKGSVRTGINLMITMLLGGLWHGAAARFVLWGGLHGAALVVNKIWQHIFRGVTRRSRAARLAGLIVTFNFVSFAWIFFRAGSMEEASLMLGQIFFYFNPGDYGKVLIAYLPVLILIISGYIFHFLPVTVKEAYRGLFIRLPVAVKFLVVIGTALILYVVGNNVVQPFIYFRF
jgi:D-alanyl-lipoteichoic acid acyltransferase DltB (MBOAT superfamily)